MVYIIEFYAYLPKIWIYFLSSFRLKVGSGSVLFLSRIRYLILFPGLSIIHIILHVQIFRLNKLVADFSAPHDYSVVLPEIRRPLEPTSRRFGPNLGILDPFLLLTTSAIIIDQKPVVCFFLLLPATRNCKKLMKSIWSK